MEYIMNYEDIKENLQNYITESNLTYLRKSHVYDFATKYDYEIEELLDVFEYSNEIFTFSERINGTKYRRYIVVDGDVEDSTKYISEKTNLKYCYLCGCFSNTELKTSDGKYFCNIECARYSNYDYCTYCGKLEKIEFKDNTHKVCKSCLDTHLQELDLEKCNKCGHYFSKSRLYKLSDNNYLCRNCSDCLRVITSYHSHDRKSCFKPLKNNRENSIYFGYENEFEHKRKHTATNNRIYYEFYT